MELTFRFSHQISSDGFSVAIERIIDSVNFLNVIFSLPEYFT